MNGRTASAKKRKARSYATYLRGYYNELAAAYRRGDLSVVDDAANKRFLEKLQELISH